jgi:hypothetical protein
MEKTMTRAKHALSIVEGAQRVRSSKKQENILSLRSLRLGARKFLEVVLSKISKRKNLKED